MGHVGEDDSRMTPVAAWMVGWVVVPPFLPIFLPPPCPPWYPAKAAPPLLPWTRFLGLCGGLFISGAFTGALCASVLVIPVQYVTFILKVISRSFLYRGNAVFLTLA